MKEAKRDVPALDCVTAGIREAKIDPAVVEGAAQRVWARISEQHQSPRITTAEDAPGIRGCDGFRALIPAYLASSLSEPRVLLFEDHVSECVGCRRALREARLGSVHRQPARMELAGPRRSRLKWVVALATAAALGAVIVSQGLLFHGGGTRATVSSVEGAIYRVSDVGSGILSPGQEIGEGDEVRTTEGSHAVLRLVDGSLVEMNERADLTLSKGWRGSTIHLERGKIIVQAAAQKSGRLYVSTRDCRVAVKGTVFSVSQGAKGARVSVIQGLVEVDQGRHSRFLHAGEQVSTDASLAGVSVRDEIAWSPNSGQYLALLGEFKGLEKRWEGIPSPGLRYTSKLTGLVPEGTVLYLAIPNIGSTLSQAHQILQQRIQESEVLRQWWEQQQASSSNRKPNLETMIEKIESFSQYLGDEVVLAVPADVAGKYSSGVVLAEVKRPDLPQFLAGQFGELGGSSDKLALRLIENPANLPAGPVGKSEGALAFVGNGYLVVTSDPVELRKAAALIERSGSSRFSVSPFYSAIRQAYESGATWLFCADLEQIVAHSVHEGGSSGALEDGRTGLRDVKYLVVERKDNAGQSENRATLTFAQERRGIASWLSAPSPAGSLDFVSPDASLAASFVLKDPRSVIEELFSFIQGSDPQFSENLRDSESKSGLSVTDDLAGSLGGDLTFALDGPLLPTPSWKMAIEVDDPARLESSIERLTSDFGGQSGGKLELTKEQADGRTFYALRSSRSSSNAASPPEKHEVSYTFVDGYLLAAPDRDALRRSIQNRETGYSLSRSADFRSRLPRDGYANFSAMVYHNLGPALSVVTDRLKSSSALTPAQRESIEALSENNAPGVVCFYGEPTQIVAASTGSFFGLGLDTLFGHAGPFPLARVMGLAAGQTGPAGQNGKDRRAKP